MATEMPTELESFHRFLTEQLETGGAGLSPEDSVKAFRAYQHDLARLRKDIRPAVERFRRGQPGRELDYNAVKDELTQRLTEEGITD